MSYTHHWYRPEKIGPVVWGRIVEDTQRVLAALPKDVAVAGAVGVGTPVVGRDLIAFNGATPQDYESFHVWRVLADPAREIQRYGLCSAFCKTGGAPYDLAVCAILVVLKHHLRDRIKVFSDGGNREWADAKALCQRTLGYGSAWTFAGDACELSRAAAPGPKAKAKA